MAVPRAEELLARLTADPEEVAWLAFMEAASKLEGFHDIRYSQVGVLVVQALWLELQRHLIAGYATHNVGAALRKQWYCLGLSCYRLWMIGCSHAEA